MSEALPQHSTILTQKQRYNLEVLNGVSWISVRGAHRHCLFDVTKRVLDGLVKRGYAETGRAAGTRGAMYSITDAGREALRNA